MNLELLNGLTEKVIGASFEVANTLGVGFLEKVYERALVRELRMQGVAVESQVALAVQYKGESVGEFSVDLLVEKELVVELKCAERLGAEHTAQCLNYLKASGKGLCLLINFQRSRLEWRRVIFAEGEGRVE